MKGAKYLWAWVVVAVGASVASAAVVHMEVGELTVVADRIVIGDVLQVTSFWNVEQTLIRSRIEVAVSDYLKGEGGTTLTLEMDGGTVGEMTLYVSVNPTFEVGQHLVLFLDGPTNRLTGRFQGAYLSDGNLAVQSQPGCGCGDYLPPVPMGDLLAEIVEALSGGKLPGEISGYKGGYTLPLGQKFTLLQCNWAYQAVPMGENYFVNGNCADASAGSAANQRAAINAGADAWTNQGADFAFSFGGTTSATVVSFNGANISFFSSDGGIANSTIATTWFWCSGGNMLEWDMEWNDPDFNFWDGVTGACSGMQDIQAVAAHEFGHCLGLGHSNTFGATMWGSIGTCSTGPRSLHQDDIDGLFTIYFEDLTPPNPNPLTFSTLPLALDVDEVVMLATLATDALSPPVEYFFDFVSGGLGGTDSAWQASIAYQDPGLETNTQYTYRTKARDSAPTLNETAYSASASVYTHAAVPGAPGLSNLTASSMDLDVLPSGNPGATEFAVQCSNSTDGAWNGQWVDATGNPSASEVWQTEVAWDATTITGMLNGTQYCFKAKARNGDLVETILSAETCGTTLVSAATIDSAASILTHDVTDMSLDLMAVNIEPRFDGVMKIEFGISESVASVSTSVACINNTYTGTITTTPAGTMVTVDFAPALPDGDRCDITLTGDVNDSFEVRTIRGDANLDGTTNPVDNNQRLLRFGQSAAVAGAQWDYNQDEAVNPVDSNQTLLVFGNTAP